MIQRPSTNPQRIFKRLVRYLRRTFIPINSCRRNAILVAAVSGDLRELTELLDETDPNIRFSDGTTLLTNVIVSDSINSTTKHEILSILHSRGAYADWPGKDGITPLMLATGLGDVDLCSALIHLGASVRRSDRNGDTALIWAASTNTLPSLMSLLNAGALADHRGQHRRTALMYAARNGAVRYVQELCDAGADPSLKDSEGAHALSLACSSGQREVALLLIDKVPDPYRNLSLLYAAAVGFEHIVEHRIREKADLLERNEHGFSPLDLSIMYSRYSVFDRLLPLYADKPEVLNQALGCAALSDSLEVARKLLDAGASPNTADEIGDTPLIHAARKNGVVIIEFLIANGANPLQKNHAGDDAIDTAQRFNSSEALQLLARASRMLK
jgi:ankyrin repeat protein